MPPAIGMEFACGERAIGRVFACGKRESVCLIEKRSVYEFELHKRSARAEIVFRPGHKYIYRIFGILRYKIPALKAPQSEFFALRK